VYDKLLERNPENVELLGRQGYLWYNAARDLYNAGDKDAAQPVYERSLPYFEGLLEIDGERDNYRGIYADALKKAGQNGKAAEQWLLLIQKDETKRDLYCNVGFAFLDEGDWQKAIELAMQAIGENSPNQDCLYSIWGKGLEAKSNALVQDYQFDKSISTYNEAKAKFSLALGGKQFGDYALKQITRQDQLIERAKQLKLKAAQDE
jgi:tetratricopeptide (TPR) repeat protein